MSGIKASTISSAMLALEAARQALMIENRDFFKSQLCEQMIDAQCQLKAELEISAVSVPVQGGA